MEKYEIVSFSLDTLDVNIKKLFGNIHQFINIPSIYKITNFMEKAKLLKINFNGGALIKTGKLKDEFVIDDYDVFLVDEKNEEMFLASKKQLLSSGFVLDSESSGTLTTQQTAILQDIDGTSYDFLLKKKEAFEKIVGGAFDIDLLFLEIKKNDRDRTKISVELKNASALESLHKKIAIFRGHTKDYNRVLKRMLVLIAKFDIENFVVKDKVINVSENPLNTSENLRKIKEILPEMIDKSKASTLMKFFSMFYRVSTPLDYVLKINNSHIFEENFPELSKILKNDKFISFLATEQYSKSKQLNNEMNVFDKLLFYAEDKEKFINECKILSYIESDKQTHIFKLIFGKLNSFSQTKLFTKQ